MDGSHKPNGGKEAKTQTAHIFHDSISSPKMTKLLLALEVRIATQRGGDRGGPANVCIPLLGAVYSGVLA